MLWEKSTQFIRGEMKKVIIATEPIITPCTTVQKGNAAIKIIMNKASL